MEDKQLYEKIGNEYKEFVPITDILSIIDKSTGMSAKDLFNTFNHIKLEWKGDVTNTRLSVPVQLRHNGLYITYNDGTVEEAHQIENTETYEGGKDYWGFQHIRQIEQFYRACLDECPLEIDGEEALKTHKLICEIYNVGGMRK